MSERVLDLNLEADCAIEDVKALADLLSRADLTDETPEYVGRIGVMISRRLKPIKQFFDYHAYGKQPDEST